MSEAPIHMGISFKQNEGKKTVCIINNEFVLELSPLQEEFLKVLLKNAKENPEAWTSAVDLEREIKGEERAKGQYLGRYKATWQHLCRYLKEKHFFDRYGIPESDFIEFKRTPQREGEREVSHFRIKPLLKLVVEEGRSD